MRIETLEARWLDEQQRVTLAELAEVSGLPEALLAELVETGALVPAETRAEGWTFSSTCVSVVRSAGRLRNDFDLDTGGLSLALRLLERIEMLEDEIRQLRAGR
jgi:chaperone modulatory protein CbpM